MKDHRRAPLRALERKPCDFRRFDADKGAEYEGAMLNSEVGQVRQR